MLTATASRPARSPEPRPSRQSPKHSPKPSPKPAKPAKPVGRGAPARTAAEQPRPLRVVARPDAAELKRRRRARTFVVATAAVAALCLFGVAATHVLLMQGQFELEQLQREAAAEQAEYDRLRLEVAERESPDQIVAAAQQRLGMVVPPTIRYLAPSPDALPPPPTGRATAGADRAQAAAPPASWATVKPLLDEG